MALAELLSVDFALVPAREQLPALPARRADYAVATTEERRIAIEKLEFCRLAISIKSECRVGLEEACKLTALRHSEKFPELLRKGKGGKSALNYHNARQWLKLLGKTKDGSPDWNNSANLCDNYVRGAQERPGSPAFWETFFAIYLNRAGLSIPEAYRDAAKKIRECYSLAWIPAEHQCRYQVSKLDLQDVILARLGQEALKAKCLDFIRRDWDSLLPGELFVADNRELDFPCRQWDEEKQSWIAKRAYLCMIIDAKSWVPLAWRLSLEPITGVTIANTFAEAIYRNGNKPPSIFYSDNGADFCKQGFASDVEIEGHKHSIFREIGTELLNAIAYNARAKTVERFFLDLANWFDKKKTGYLGNCPGARPDSAAFFYKNPETLLSLQQLEDALKAYFEDYIQRSKHGKIHKGQSPLEIWQGKHYEAPVWSEDRLRFAMLMPLKETRTVNKGLCLAINGVEYGSTDLRHHFGKKLMVKIDWLDPEHVFAFEVDGRLICECKTKRAINAIAKTEADRKLIGEELKGQREELRYWENHLNALTGGLHKVSPDQIMAAPIGAKLVKVGEMNSVKGAAHKFKVYELKAPDEKAPLQLEFKADKVEAKLKEFEAVAIEEKEEDAPKVSPDAMAAFHSMMTQRKPEEDI